MHGNATLGPNQSAIAERSPASGVVMATSIVGPHWTPSWTRVAPVLVAAVVSSTISPGRATARSALSVTVTAGSCAAEECDQDGEQRCAAHHRNSSIGITFALNGESKRAKRRLQALIFIRFSGHFF